MDELIDNVGKKLIANKSVAQYEFACWPKITLEEIQRFKATDNGDVSASPGFDVVCTVVAHLANSKVVRVEVCMAESY